MSVAELKIVVPGIGEEDERMEMMLESFISRVKAGEISFLGIIATYRDGSSISSGFEKRGDASRFQILGAIEDMKLDFWAKSIQDC